MPEPSREPLIPQPFSLAIDAGLSYLTYRLLRYAVARRLSMRSFATLEVIDAPGGASVGGRSVLPGPVSRVPRTPPSMPTGFPPPGRVPEGRVGAASNGTALELPTFFSRVEANPPRVAPPPSPGAPSAVTVFGGGGPTQVIAPPAPPEAVGLPTVTQLPGGARTQLIGPARPTVLGPTPPTPPPVDLGEGMGFPGGGSGRPGALGSLPLPRLLPLPLAGQLGVQAGRALAEAQQGPVPGGPVTLSELGSVLTTGPAGLRLFGPSAPDVLPPGTSVWPGAVFPPAPSPGGLGWLGFALPGAAGGADWAAAPPAPAFAFPGPFAASPPRPAFAFFPPGAGLFSQGGPAGAGTGAVGGQPGRVVLPPGLIR